jgi:hypothetical protein
VWLAKAPRVSFHGCHGEGVSRVASTDVDH